jgi:hypothetical protein
MTRTVADAALMLTVISEPDGRDWHALPADRRDYRIGLEAGIAGLRLAYSRRLGYVDFVDPEVATLVGRAVETLSDLGAMVEEVDPGFGNPAETFRAHWFAGAANLLRRYSDDQRARMDPGLVATALEGAGQSLLDYLAAVDRRGALGSHMRRFHERYDALVTPQMPLAAFAIGIDTPEGPNGRWVDWTPFTYPFNLTGQPAASVPCGLTAAGLPVAFQVVGPMFCDALVLRIARAFEAVQPFALPERPGAEQAARKPGPQERPVPADGPGEGSSSWRRCPRSDAAGSRCSVAHCHDDRRGRSARSRRPTCGASGRTWAGGGVAAPEPASSSAEPCSRNIITSRKSATANSAFKENVDMLCIL